MATTAEQLVEVLVQADVRRIQGVVGDSPRPLVDTVRRSPVVRVYVRNQVTGASATAADVPSARVDEPGDGRDTLARRWPPRVRTVSTW
jgi:thiamine pyrophosphate-dependent acetolactate synthase large subunit-like protein